MMLLVDWLCLRLIMAWPHPWPDCGKNRVFAEMLARAGRYANDPRHLTAKEKP